VKKIIVFLIILLPVKVFSLEKDITIGMWQLQNPVFDYLSVTFEFEKNNQFIYNLSDAKNKKADYRTGSYQLKKRNKLIMGNNVYQIKWINENKFILKKEKDKFIYVRTNSKDDKWQERYVNWLKNNGYYN
jgi:hypothetical protein